MVACMEDYFWTYIGGNIQVLLDWQPAANRLSMLPVLETVAILSIFSVFVVSKGLLSPATDIMPTTYLMEARS